MHTKTCGTIRCDFFFGYSKCEILVTQPRIKVVSPVMEACSLNHWTTRKVPHCNSLIRSFED